jgi:exonuclease VII small subunit
MGKLEDAVKRLERAVARLEKALGRAADADAARHGALSAAQADYAALLETTESVAGRLDAAILRLDRALEG